MSYIMKHQEEKYRVMVISLVVDKGLVHGQTTEAYFDLFNLIPDGSKQSL